MNLRDQVAEAIHDDDDCCPPLGDSTWGNGCGFVDDYRGNADAALKVVAEWLRSAEAAEGLPWHAESGIQLRCALAAALTKESP